MRDDLRRHGSRWWIAGVLGAAILGLLAWSTLDDNDDRTAMNEKSPPATTGAAPSPSPSPSLDSPNRGGAVRGSETR
jgi:hypothetical protein